MGGALALVALVAHVEAKGFAVLHAFTGTDGANSYSNLIRDATGNLYGTTDGGGAGKDCFPAGCGTVFKLAPDGTESVIYSFGMGNGDDGLLPVAGLIADKKGNFYGTTQTATNGYGTVFKVAPDGTESIIHLFAGGSDGAMPVTPLVSDKTGDLYGTTYLGGGSGCGGSGCGIVFEIASDGTETVLHAFTGKNGDGAIPAAGLMVSGNKLYGTTLYGGTNQYGTVFRISRGGSETVLYSFAGGPSDGANPAAGLIADAAGNLYGTTDDGGAYQFGAVFKLTQDNTETIVHSFAGGSDGAYPMAALYLDTSGSLLGTTNNGGGNGCGGEGCGTVFKIAPDGTETVLHAFRRSDGVNPEANLTGDKKGHLYGTAPYGGANGYGTVFRLKE